MEMTNDDSLRQGLVTTIIERRTAKTLSDSCVWSAFRSMTISPGLKLAGKKHEGLFEPVEGLFLPGLIISWQISRATWA